MTFKLLCEIVEVIYNIKPMKETTSLYMIKIIRQLWQVRRPYLLILPDFAVPFFIVVLLLPVLSEESLHEENEIKITMDFLLLNRVLEKINSQSWNKNRKLLTVNCKDCKDNILLLIFYFLVVITFYDSFAQIFGNDFWHFRHHLCI